MDCRRLPCLLIPLVQSGYFPTIASFLHRHLAHETPFSLEALSRGYGLDAEQARVGSDLTEGEKEIARQLGDESEESNDKFPPTKGPAGVRYRKAGKAVGGAGSAGPAEVVEGIEAEGVQRAKAAAER